MNKISAYAFCLIIIIIGLNFIITCNDNIKIKDKSVVEEKSCSHEIDNNIDTFTTEEVDSDDLIQGSWSPIIGYGCTD
uniref:Secreted protein n=1 Tax=Geladintestivirus 6 TaxID=3233138 RepID=A0AAU8ML89_9CAUD